MANADEDQEETEGSILDLDIFSEEFDDEEPSASQSVNPNQINLPNKESFIKLPYGAKAVESPNEESANDAPSAEEGKGGFPPFSSFFDINFNDIYGKKILSNVIQRYASQLEKKDFFTDTKKRGLKPKLHNELFSDNIIWNNKSFRGNVWNTNKTIKSNIGLPIEKEIKKSNEKKNIINLKIEKKVNVHEAEKRNINLMVEKKVNAPGAEKRNINLMVEKKVNAPGAEKRNINLMVEKKINAPGAEKININLMVEKKVNAPGAEKRSINLMVEKKVNAPGAEKRSINLMVEKKNKIPITVNEKIDFSIDKKLRQEKNFFFQINASKKRQANEFKTMSVDLKDSIWKKFQKL